MTLVSDILRNKGETTVTVQPTSSVEQAAAVLTKHGVGALVVSSDGLHIEGILSERDIVRGVASNGLGALELLVSDLMTAEVVTCEPSDNTETLMNLMTDRRIRHLPVKQDDSLGGVVSIGDIVKARIAELKIEKEQLHDYITTGR